MCGIFGVAGHDEASNLAYLGLYALQHRAQEGAGIVSSNEKKLFRVRKRGLVSDVFDSRSFVHLPGKMAIGHVRYSTTGASIQRNLQPFVASGEFGTLSVAHNGNLTNFPSLKSRLEKEGALFQSTMDSEVFLHLASRAKGDSLSEKIANSFEGVEGAFSLVYLSEKELFAVRDPWGFRPLCLGYLKGMPVISSESCAFDLIGAKYEREIQPGEMVVLSSTGKVTSRIFSKPKKQASCVFEHIYFSRPDSLIFGESSYEIRKKLGKVLAKEHPVSADVVISVPDSGAVAAMGYAEESGIPLEMGLIRNHYVGRTFIEPQQTIRGFGVKVKLNPVRSVLEGKSVAVVDDSIVRGTTSKKIVKMLRDAGAKKVYMLISCPPWISPCYYGINTPTKEELIASSRTQADTCSFIGADELHYLSLDGVYSAIGKERNQFCDACFTENYPTSVANVS